MHTYPTSSSTDSASQRTIWSPRSSSGNIETNIKHKNKKRSNSIHTIHNHPPKIKQLKRAGSSVSKKLLDDVRELRRQAVFFPPGEWDWETFLKQEEQHLKDQRNNNHNNHSTSPQPSQSCRPTTSKSLDLEFADFAEFSSYTCPIPTTSPLTSSTIPATRRSSCSSICLALQQTTLYD